MRTLPLRVLRNPVQSMFIVWSVGRKQDTRREDAANWSLLPQMAHAAGLDRLQERGGSPETWRSVVEADLDYPHSVKESDFAGAYANRWNASQAAESFRLPVVS